VARGVGGRLGAAGSNIYNPSKFRHVGWII
jgi:hypothetical protein